MFARNQMATITHSQTVVVDPIVPKPATTLEDRLREIARRHQVCYEVFPEWSMEEGQKIQIGFELELCGISSNEKCLYPVPGCPHCVRTYDEIRQIAEWTLPREERPSHYEIQSFDRALHIAPRKRQGRNEVVVRIVIMHRREFNRPVDDCESRCLKEMRERLSALGVNEEIWRGE